MENPNYTSSIKTNLDLATCFQRTNQVQNWWTENLEGKTSDLGAEFSVRFADVHYSKQRIVEFVPNSKVVWLVINSNLNWLQKKEEWTGTKVCFEFSAKDKHSIINITHIGLSPEVECYENCIKGWDYFIGQSLKKLLTEGKGAPDKKLIG
ncbi:MAG: SRPBCC domain-containing protein [Bacteroidetes bacterium]|nr:SRPBCC domain-containing protein [Bacteroidota bacterium]MBS1932077.1 SRPBCC domain-containing protein [Bacteroidota bacterium]